MEKPYKYFIFDNTTHMPVDGAEFNELFMIPSRYRDGQHQIYVDNRYDAKLRLFYYLHPEQRPKPYRLYEGTEIGKSIPILSL